MTTTRQEDIEKIKVDLEKEFPNDPALQQIHLSRKILAKEAEEKGISFIEYIRSEAKSLIQKGTPANRPNKED